MVRQIDFEKAKLNGFAGIIVLSVLLALCIGLSIFLFHNPYKDLQQAVFATAERIRNYYRDTPGYWKLSTQSAKQDNLLRDDLLKYKDYDIQAGQGINGEQGFPSDMSFDITVKNLNKSACVSLIEMPLKEQASLTLLKITIITAQAETEFSWGGQNSLPVAKYSARNFCQAKDNIISWTFQ
ncbi:MAG: hypothetical protein Q4D80_00075 [Pseudomonadota bacterium]|nr:hypothetical protein [Pseudomonadota bacterium]